MFALFAVIFFGIAIGYNLYLSEEYLFGNIKPNINKVSNEMITYLKNEPVHLPLFVFRNIGFEVYLENKIGGMRNLTGNVCTTHNHNVAPGDALCIGRYPTFYLDFKDEWDPETADRRREHDVGNRLRTPASLLLLLLPLGVQRGCGF